MLRNHHTLVLNDEEYAHILSALGRVDDPGGFSYALDFYSRMMDNANNRVKTLFSLYYPQMTFSKVRELRRR